MNEKQMRQAIKKVVTENYLGHKVNFKEAGTFKVKNYKIRTRKRLIPAEEFEDFGVDEDTQQFFIVEFWDSKEENDVMDACACIFTLNSKGQVGTSDAPWGFELELAYDFAIDMADQITEHFKKGGR